MSTIVAPSRGASLTLRLSAYALAPATLVFLSSNIVNVGNLAFNVIFSRLLGPEMFGILAVLLTAKLSYMGVMGALQMAVTERVAATSQSADKDLRIALAAANTRLTLMLVALLVLLVIVLKFAGDLTSQMRLPDAHYFLLFLLGVPFGAALSILRGVAFGKMHTARIVASGQFEMLVRLGGSLAAWFLGFGLEGIIVAIAASIIAGWVVLCDLLPVGRNVSAPSGILKGLAIGAFPFTLLQLGQVLALDGDVLLANQMLPAPEAGYVAALSLFQRIQFFACFALASVLIPSVIVAAQSGRSLRGPVLPVAVLYAAVTVPALGAAALWPTELIGILVGNDYLAAAVALFPAVLAAALFTASYLAASLLVAIGDKSGIAILFAVALSQLTLIYVLKPSTLQDFIAIKLTCQMLTAIALLALSATRIRKMTRRPH